MSRKYNTVIVGTGAAGYAAAMYLKQNGVSDIAIVTEGKNTGTSRNTGSDKQTYYKLSLAGDAPDSVRLMAQDLTRGGCTDGDTALCEAALSVRCFMNLCTLGVPFPTNRYGEAVGYKTDHDPYARASSVGPLTSKYMTEALEREVVRLGVPIHDGLLAVEILHEDAVCGLMAVQMSSGEAVLFECEHVILATGGPAGIYADSVYPECHTGATGLAVKAGAKLQNLTEWQYGLASVSPRWNVSGTYLQVLPRLVSVDEDGEHEFLLEFFEDPYTALSQVFIKGYQWPFDSNKVLSGSSVLDLLVYRECVLYGRRVYLDYTKNPFNLKEIEFHRLSQEAFSYLDGVGACFGTPFERLMQMNAPAVELYRSKGVDLSSEYLEIALSAQHNNGGVAVDAFWRTSLPGLYAVGECAGTHGISRPGGSALNAGQVGAFRAAYCIAHTASETDPLAFERTANATLERHRAFCAAVLRNDDNCEELIVETRRKTSDGAAALRNSASVSALKTETETLLRDFSKRVGTHEVFRAYQFYDTLLTQLAVLCAMEAFASKHTCSRGGALYYRADGVLREGLEELFRFCPDDGTTHKTVQEISFCGLLPTVTEREVRPIPPKDEVFETVWQAYRENKLLS